MTLDFEQSLEKYAEVAVKIGLDFRKGQALHINAPVDARPMVQAVVRQAYRAGARSVYVNWNDPELGLIKVQEASDEALEEFPTFIVDYLTKHMDAGDAILSISGSDPDLLAGQDPMRLKKIQMTAAKANNPVSERIVNNVTNWLIVMVPHPALSMKVFPDLSPEEAKEKHWEAIFKMCRIDGDDPVAKWEAHVTELQKRSQYLNEKSYSALHYTATGTDLTIGLPKGHLWITAGLEAKNGTKPIVNMPTEEIFTLPHRDQVHGVVRSTKPLNYMGTVIDNFTLQVSEGSVVSGKAEKGQDALDILLATDEGVRSFGEVALVPHSSPISQSGLTFFNTLYDENASCHLALGRAYRFTLDGGVEMDDAGFEEAGGNNSLAHVDFMIGSEELNIDGITADGTREPVMRNGEWAFEV